MRKIIFEISSAEKGMMIKDFLKNFGVSSSLLTKLKQTENGITKNGIFAKAIEHLNEGDTLEIAIESKGHMPAPSDKAIDILYEDEDILVADKPPFMPVHESRNHRGDALSNAVAAHMKEDTAFRAVFRLDRDTSGAVLIAKHELAASKLAGNIKKDYYAVVCGKIAEGGTIDLPIKRLGESIIKRCVAEDGERAVTHFEPVKIKDSRTLLKIHLETGRTHQIRVHFSHIGFPLVGDSLYGNESDLINRQALHCRDIYFTHPVTEKEMHICCDFPPDFKKLI